MSGANLQRYVDDEQITKNYLKSNPKLKLDSRDINSAREAYRISEEGFYHIRPQQFVSEEWAVYKDYIENPDHASLINKTNDQIKRRENPLKQNILAGSSLVV
ncbi:MAG: hypothetical protein PHS57_03085 [Alphaproteobacteria bacterium]|nr:hypothetical protein [Alphaproteobacteria bacterium]